MKKLLSNLPLAIFAFLGLGPKSCDSTIEKKQDLSQFVYECDEKLKNAGTGMGLTIRYTCVNFTGLSFTVPAIFKCM